MFFDMLCNTLEILLTFTLASSGMVGDELVGCVEVLVDKGSGKVIKMCFLWNQRRRTEKIKSHSCVTLFKLESTLDTQAEVGLNEDIQIILINDHLIKSLFIMCWAQNKQQHCCGHHTKLSRSGFGKWYKFSF